MQAGARRWTEGVARAGFVAKGAVYLVLGTLAARAAVGMGGRVTDAHGVLRSVLQASYGRLLLGLLAAGLFGYALWRFMEAFADANGKGRGVKGLGARTGYAVSGAIYGSLAVEAARLAARLPTQSGGGVDTTMDAVLAGWMVPVAGVLLVAYAVQQASRAFSSRLSERLQVGSAVRDYGNWIVTVSRIGIGARAVVFLGVGMLLVTSTASRPSAAADTGTGDSLRWLSNLPNGEWVLAATGAGLFAYGVYQLIHARYRRVTPPAAL
jgi:hypothetical protein